MDIYEEALLRIQKQENDKANHPKDAGELSAEALLPALQRSRSKRRMNQLIFLTLLRAKTYREPAGKPSGSHKFMQFKGLA
ncbi:MAG: hypothetical protein RLZZ164_505 [Actinomycetota bacterium]|jgi:hypothetical protein